MKKERVTIEAIRSFDVEKLARWLYQKAMQDDQLYDGLERLLISADPKAAVKALKSEIAGINRSRKFLEYGKSFEYARKLDDLLDRIVEIDDTAIQLELLEHFIKTDAKVYNRCDDSAGVIQTVYRRAQEAWKNSARILDEPHLYKALMRLRICEGFGTRDIFGAFIPRPVLEQIYDEIYQKVASSRLPKYETAFDDLATLRACAHYLKSPEKYIQAIELFHEEIPDYELVGVAREFLHADRAKESVEILEAMRQIPPNDKERYFALLIEGYDRLKDEQAVTETYRKWYEASRDPSVLQKYLKRLDPSAREAVVQKALEDAKKMEPIQAIHFFKTMDAKALAARYIMERAGDLQLGYLDAKALNALVKWLSDEDVEVAILLYRDRTESTLKGSISKYYPWAIRHLESMVKLANKHKIERWSIEPNALYIKRLAKIHERKTRFQSLLKESRLLNPYLREENQ